MIISISYTNHINIQNNLNDEKSSYKNCVIFPNEIQSLDISNFHTYFGIQRIDCYIKRNADLT